MGISVFPIPSSGGVTPKVETFTSTGTWTCPSNVTSIDLFLVGGGGGGGGGRAQSNNFGFCGGGGGGGSVFERTVSVVPGTVYTFTIGAGGSGGQGFTGAGGGSAGAVGSDSTMTGSGFTTITALGGGGASGRNQSTGVTYTGTPRGTSAGQWCAANGVAGGGGGAGGSAFSFLSSATINNPFALSAPTGIIYVQNPEGTRFTGGSGGAGVNADTYGFSQAGIGINGYGNGGPGSGISTSGNTTVTSFSGITVRRGSDCTAENGTAAVANSGNGGGGGIAYNRNDCGGQSCEGGAGGSGFAMIKYMS